MKKEITFDDFVIWLDKQGYSIRYFAHASLLSRSKTTSDADVRQQKRILEMRFNEGTQYYKEHFIDNEIIWGETTQGTEFWQTLYDSWRQYFDELIHGKKSEEKYASSINLYKWLIQVSNKTIVRAFAKPYIENSIIFPRKMYRIDEAIEILSDAYIILENKQDQDLFHETVEKWRGLLEYYAKHGIGEIFIDWQVYKDLGTCTTEVQKITGEKMKPKYLSGAQTQLLKALSKRFYTGSKKEKAEAVKLIEEFFQAYFMAWDQAQNKFNLTHHWKHQQLPHYKLYFSGNVKFSALAQRIDQAVFPRTEDLLQYMAEVQHGRYVHNPDFEWVLPECKKHFVEYLNGDQSQHIMYSSNTKVIWFNAKKKKVCIEYKQTQKKYCYEFDAQELMV